MRARELERQLLECLLFYIGGRERKIWFLKFYKFFFTFNFWSEYPSLELFLRALTKRCWNKFSKYKRKKKDFLSCSFRYAVDHCVFMFLLCCKLWKQHREQHNIHKICVKISREEKNLTPWLVCLVANDTGSLCLFLAFVCLFFLQHLSLASHSLQKYHNLSDVCLLFCFIGKL